MRNICSEDKHFNFNLIWLINFLFIALGAGFVTNLHCQVNIFVIQHFLIVFCVLSRFNCCWRLPAKQMNQKMSGFVASCFNWLQICKGLFCLKNLPKSPGFQKKYWRSTNDFSHSSPLFQIRFHIRFQWN